MHRLKCAHGWYEHKLPIRPLPKVGCHLLSAERRPPPAPLANTTDVIASAERMLDGNLRYFGRHWKALGSPPQWFKDPWTGHAWNEEGVHWSRVREFAAVGADIKVIWEPSRFEWLVVLARA